jgi:Domain of unknown function (DUF222)
LVGTLKELRKRENTLVADIVSYLAEVDSRQIYREQGYSSLFSFCTQALRYSEGAAQRRIIAARCLRSNPEVYELLKEGKVSLCALSEVAKVITPENKREILDLSQGLPKQEAQKLAAQYQPAAQPKRETIRAKKVHAIPFSHGGESSRENLRLKCKSHNLLYAEEVFGREFMDQKKENLGRG